MFSKTRTEVFIQNRYHLELLTLKNTSRSNYEGRGIYKALLCHDPYNDLKADELIERSIKLAVYENFVI
jgi:hypothetical protein